MPCCHFLSPTIASRSMWAKCLMSNLMASHSASASPPSRAGDFEEQSHSSVPRDESLELGHKVVVICFCQLPADVNDEDLPTVFFIELNGHLELLWFVLVNSFSVSASADPPSPWFKHTRFLHRPFPFLSFSLTPFPVTDFRQVFAVLVDVLLVLDELVLDHLLQVRPSGAQVRQPVHHVLHQVEAVQVILDPHEIG